LFGNSGQFKRQLLLVTLRNLPQSSFFLRNSIGRRRNQLKTEIVRLSGKVFKFSGERISGVRSNSFVGLGVSLLKRPQPRRACLGLFCAGTQAGAVNSNGEDTRST